MVCAFCWLFFFSGCSAAASLVQVTLYAQPHICFYTGLFKTVTVKETRTTCDAVILHPGRSMLGKVLLGNNTSDCVLGFIESLNHRMEKTLTITGSSHKPTTAKFTTKPCI